MIRSLIVVLCLGALPTVGMAAEAVTTFQRGEQAEQELRIDEARDLFRRALAENPEAPGVAEHTAWFLFLNGFHDEECRDLFRRAAPQGQQPEAMERAARFIERKLGVRGPADEAEQQAEAAFHRLMIEQAAKGTDEQLGGALVDAGDFVKGIPLLEKALAANPTNAPLALRLARARVWAQKYPEADAAYEKLLERHPGNAVLLLEAGQVAAGLGMLERARTLLAAADKARPNDPQIRREQANLEAKFAQQAAAKPEELPAPKPLPAVDSTFARGEKAEKQLNIYEARDLFREALRE